jgi:hydrogenase/urease accessory protein HupE
MTQADRSVIMSGRLFRWILCSAFLCTTLASAHEVRPAYLQITQTPDHGYEVLWKRPVMGEVAVHLVPHLSGGWLERKPTTIEVTSGFSIETWQIAPGARPALESQAVSIEGLPGTITDALVIVRLADGSKWQRILTPVHAAERLSLGSHSSGALPTFLPLGFEHILTGIDHLLFVLGLLLIVERRGMLLKTITAFTLAHSITLAVATLGYARVPVPFVNAAIALSILFLGPEIVRRRHGETSLTLRHPWVVAFAFGLLHGFGFASGLSVIGLPSHELLWALLLFNVGVEIGQLMFVGLILWLAHAFRVLVIRWPWPMQVLPAYSVGTLGAFWTIQRVFMLLGGGA